MGPIGSPGVYRLDPAVRPFKQRGSKSAGTSPQETWLLLTAPLPADNTFSQSLPLPGLQFPPLEKDNLQVSPYSFNIVRKSKSPQARVHHVNFHSWSESNKR